VVGGVGVVWDGSASGNGSGDVVCIPIVVLNTWYCGAVAVTLPPRETDTGIMGVVGGAIDGGANTTVGGTSTRDGWS
jgi:hypothetical protein